MCTILNRLYCVEASQQQRLYLFVMFSFSIILLDSSSLMLKNLQKDIEGIEADETRLSCGPSSTALQMVTRPLSSLNLKKQYLQQKSGRFTSSPSVNHEVIDFIELVVTCQKKNLRNMEWTR